MLFFIPQVVLSLELDNINESIADSLVTLVTSCRTLRHLFVNAVLSVDTIDDICTMQIERKLGKNAAVFLPEILFWFVVLRYIKPKTAGSFKNKY